MRPPVEDPIARLVAATNAHDLDALADCFADDYVNETPAHPSRGFEGRAQVRRNWETIFQAVPDITAQVVASAASGADTWTEWQMRGTRRDGAMHAMAGVVIFTVANDRISSARFYLEPVDLATDDVNATVGRIAGGPPS